MSIQVFCSCGEEYRANEALAARTVTCAACQQRLRIPDPDNDPPAPPATRFRADNGPVAADKFPTCDSPPRHTATAWFTWIARRRALPTSAVVPQPLPPPEQPTAAPSGKPATRSRHLPWLLVAILLPVVVLTDGAEERIGFRQRIDQTIADLPPTEQTNAASVLARSTVGLVPLDAVFEQLPGERCPGAVLPRSTEMHWLFAAGAVVLLGLVLLHLDADRVVGLRTLLRVALLSASVGLVFLCLVRLLAGWSGRWSMQLSDYSLLLVPLTDGLAFCYRGALDSGYGFVANFLSFTFVVGLGQEVIKVLPLLAYYSQQRQHHWREALLWGLACGATLGVVEGLLSCRDFHNGVGGLEMYLITFLFSVALQAAWAGCAAIAIHRNRERLRSTLDIRDYLTLLLALLAVPLLLHGLYDTLIKGHQLLLALVVGAVSFVILGLEIRRAQQGEALLEQALTE
jgi:RsiW-degrading membrane proteinase PrsW (M82 family)